MPKKPRSELAPGLVHVTNRGNRRADIITAERDVRRFEDFLEDAVRRSGVTCHAFCLMPNHVHLVFEVETIEALSKTMQRLNGRYAQWFNLTYGFNGHLFQGPYGAVAAQSESHALEMIRYVVLNPVRAGLCARPAAWPWSSYLATIGAVEKPRYLTIDWVLGLFADDVTLARERYKTFVAEGIVAPTALSRKPLSRDLDRGRTRVMAPLAGVPPVFPVPPVASRA
ncbi:MAG: transposase [Actinobacteria bacterium]|nr:MAG: transposase [Actinomycetota bacterium]